MTIGINSSKHYIFLSKLNPQMLTINWARLQKKLTSNTMHHIINTNCNFTWFMPFGKHVLISCILSVGIFYICCNTYSIWKYTTTTYIPTPILQNLRLQLPISNSAYLIPNTPTYAPPPYLPLVILNHTQLLSNPTPPYVSLP